MLSQALEDALTESRSRKYLGRGPLQAHVANAEAFTTLLPVGTATIVDLGSGGGVPSLIMVELCPGVHFTLVERSAARAQFLQDTILALGMSDRVDIVCDNAEAAAREPGLTGTADVVTARAFGRPATTAECACRFLKLGGHLLVSEPPDDPLRLSRWSRPGLARTGLVPTSRTSLNGGTFQILTLADPPHAALPRTPAATRKRPLF